MKISLFLITLVALACFSQADHYEEYENNEELIEKNETEGESANNTTGTEVEIPKEEEQAVVEECYEECEEEEEEPVGGDFGSETELPYKEEELHECASELIYPECDPVMLDILSWGADQIIKKVVCGKGVKYLDFYVKIGYIYNDCVNIDWWYVDIQLSNGHGIVIDTTFTQEGVANNWKLLGFSYQYSITAEANSAIKEWEAQYPNDTFCGNITIISICDSGYYSTGQEIPYEIEEVFLEKVIEEEKL